MAVADTDYTLIYLYGIFYSFTWAIIQECMASRAAGEMMGRGWPFRSGHSVVGA